MIQHSVSVKPAQQGIWFIVNRGRLWLGEQRKVPVCSYGELILSAEPEHICLLGQVSDTPAYLVINHDHIDDENNWGTARELLTAGDDVFQLAARAVQVALFLQTHRFCGQCGSAMSLVSWELAMLCNKCGHRCYPRIAPCVLVGIIKADKILLARSERHRPGFFSILLTLNCAPTTSFKNCSASASVLKFCGRSALKDTFLPLSSVTKK